MYTRVERSPAALPRLPVDHGLFGQAVHHGLGDQVISAQPDIDDLVVLLTLGYQDRRRTAPRSQATSASRSQ